MNFSEGSFGEQDVSDLKFTECKNIRFYGTNLEEADFKMSFLVDCFFSEVILNFSKFKKADLMRTEFKSSSLEGVDWSLSTISNSLFERVSLRDTDFDGSHIEFCEFTDCDFDSTSFANVKFKSCVFYKTKNIEEADFSGSNYEDDIVFT